MGLLFNRSRLLVLALLFLLVTIGTAGYVLIEGWSPVEALFMTVITITTIGYGEVRPLSSSGRIFTVGLIAFGVITATYAVSTVIEMLTSTEFRQHLQHQRRRRVLGKLNQHCIICGFGRLGRSLAKEMKLRDAPVLVIDQDHEAIARSHDWGLPALLGNAADERILLEAGIERASSLVAAANSDAENVFIVLTAKRMNPKLHIIARCNSDASAPKLETAGASTVILPYAIAGRRIAQLLTHPNVTSFLDGVLEFGGEQMRLEEFIITAASPLANLSLREAKLEANVLAVSHPEQTVLIHPNAETKLLPGTAIIVMGLDPQLNQLAHLAKGPADF
jgi:voltage-gated potassium channel